ncbi:MAG TPA: helicase-related protein [Rhodopila sp.]|uniref:helicase-related protein n=1 Tax=Rhodopila sp. TaxID=2480087 RepID=UPI002BDB4139|nr:helicase-related protein [Rhodopila sp.]HVY13960.1 helicase-related protein [Rhodopila sp.]
MQLTPGLRIAARGLEWDVIDADPPPDPSIAEHRRVRLCCASGDLAGLEWDILHPLEPVTVLRADPDPRAPDSLRDWWLYHTAWLFDQVPGPATQAGRMTIEPYQQVPVRRALDMVRPRLLLADGVGLGKTIQAGLIAAELLVRRRAHRILVVTPPGPLLRQWEQEMRLRFGLRFAVLADAPSLREARARLEFGGNPFEATSLCLTSIDFAKSDQVLMELERTRWDLVIIDEAHHCAQPDSRRHLLARVLSRISDGLLLLTATPHDGNDAHFAALMALLDPSLVDGAGRLVGTAYRRHVVRRLKSHIRDPRTGLPLFRERRVQPVRVMVDADPVCAFHKALSDLVLPRLRTPRDTRHLTDALAFVTLLKRSLSTLAACVATLRVVAARLGATDSLARRRERQRALRAWCRRVARYGVLSAAEESAVASLEAEEMATSLDAATAEALNALIAAGEAAIPLDPKLQALRQEIRLIRLEQPNANVLVYTEYAESQRAAAMALAELGGIVLTIAGTDTEAERTGAAEQFAEQDGIVLISTDALAEGLNLHRRCRHLIHLDLPYNPNRLEQRNGRIDRYGQVHDPDIRYCYLVGTFEERLLLKLIEKYEAARVCLDIMPDTLAVSSATGGLREPIFAGGTDDLFAGLPRLVQSLDQAAEDTASEAWRDLLREIDHAFKAFEDMAVRHGWLGGGPTGDPTDPVTEAPLGLTVHTFVAAALPDGKVPGSWATDLHALPGFDGTTNTVRLTDDPDRLHDRLYPGRAHPLTRRVIARLRAGRTGQVAAARGEVSLIATYAVETGDGRFRTLFALRQYPDGRIVDEPDWLRHADRPSMVADWDTDFAPWAGGPALDRAAGAAADRAVATHAAAEARRAEKAELEVAAWLRRRADEICGPAPKPGTGDLFAAARPVIAAAPETRLARCAADPDQPDATRQAAAEVLAIFAARPRPCASEMRLRKLGLLLLHP